MSAKALERVASCAVLLHALNTKVVYAKMLRKWLYATNARPVKDTLAIGYYFETKASLYANPLRFVKTTVVAFRQFRLKHCDQSRWRVSKDILRCGFRVLAFNKIWVNWQLKTLGMCGVTRSAL